MRQDWKLSIGFDENLEIHDYWFIEHDMGNGLEIVFGTHTPNETMARRWLSMKHLNLSENEIEELIKEAKQERGSLFTETTS